MILIVDYMKFINAFDDVKKILTTNMEYSIFVRLELLAWLLVVNLIDYIVKWK